MMRKISMSWVLGVVITLTMSLSGTVMAQQSSSSSSRSSSSRATMPPLPAGYIECASKDQICSFSGTRTVRIDSCFESSCWSSLVVATESVYCRAYISMGFARCAYSVDLVAPLDGLVATASSQSGNGRSAAKALDGLADTRWEASNSSAGSWLQIKRATPFRIRQIDILEYGNRIRGYRVEYLNGTVWTPLQEGASTNGHLLLNFNSTGPIVTTAIRIVTTATSVGQPSITEFRVEGVSTSQ
jgi:hypothetical protein